MTIDAYRANSDDPGKPENRIGEESPVYRDSQGETRDR